MLIKVTDVLNEKTVKLFASNVVWSTPVREYLNSIVGSIMLYVNVQYNNLMALNQYESIDSETIAQYLVDSTNNEIERIYKALTTEYDPKYNYHRTISEKNSGSNTNVYSGTDTEKTGGQDTTNVVDDLTVTSSGNETATVHENTYDEATVDGFRPTNKAESSYSSSEKYNGTTDTNVEYGKTVDTTYGRNLEMQFGRNIETVIDGTNGIFPYPDLIKKEYDLRVSRCLFETVIRLLVENVSCGVWTNDLDV